MKEEKINIEVSDETTPSEEATPAFHKYESYQPHTLPVDRPKSGKITQINTWLKDHWVAVLVALAILTAGIGGTFFYLFHSLQFQPISAVKPVKKKEVQKFYSPLTGVEVPESDTKRPVTGIMIENSPDARPQSGLKDAGVVFESVAEGGITRFLVLYQEGKPETIGPVRSVRPQFASWVAAFDAGLGHVGGSDIPLKKLRSGQIKDLDQFFNSNSYTRVGNRAAPHNVYTSIEKLDELNKKKGYTSSTFTAWKRKLPNAKEKVTTTPTAKTISVPVSTGIFAVSYSWDSSTNTYLRSEGGAAHNDREKGQLSPKVVIVMQVPHDVIRDSNNYSYPDVIGNGKAWLFQDGAVTEITWSKSSDKEQIIFNDASGKRVELEAGQTWITAIRPDTIPTWQP